jgi:hypothetical protein
MDPTYFEGRLKASIAMLNAATDPCARVAHRGLVEGYRQLVLASQAKTERRSATLPAGSISHRALSRWADDGGRTGKAQ